MGLRRFSGFGLRVQGFGVTILDLRLRSQVSGFELRVQDLRSQGERVGFGGEGLGFRVWGAHTKQVVSRVSGLAFSAQGLCLRVKCLIPGLMIEGVGFGFRVDD